MTTPEAMLADIEAGNLYVTLLLADWIEEHCAPEDSAARIALLLRRRYWQCQKKKQAIADDARQREAKRRAEIENHFEALRGLPGMVITGEVIIKYDVTNELARQDELLVSYVRQRIASL